MVEDGATWSRHTTDSRIVFEAAVMPRCFEPARTRPLVFILASFPCAVLRSYSFIRQRGG